MDDKRKKISKSKSKSPFLVDAEKAAKIVNEGIEKGEFSSMNEELESLSSKKDEREQYVFPCPNNIGNTVFAAIAGFLALGFVCLVLISTATLMYSKEYRLYGLIGLLGSVAIELINICIIIINIRTIKFFGRYRKYSNLLKYRSIEIVEDLAVFTNVSVGIVINDLQKAVKRKYIPEGHFGTDNNIFITSNEIYARYKGKQAVYDRYYRKQIEERARMKERSKEMAQIMEFGQKYKTKIHETNDIIKDKVVSHKLDEMEKIVSMIFHEVDINPDQADKLGLFLNYYMPTTEKLLEAYIDLDEKQVKGKSLEKAKKEIEDSLDTINTAFEGILDRFYQEQELDIVSDISAMEIMMKQEGLKE